MTLETLKTNTRKELAALAKRHRVAGWHGMRKEELIEALLDVHRSTVGGAAPTQRSVARVKAERQNPRVPASGNSTATRTAGFSRASARSTSTRRDNRRPPTPGTHVVRRDISTTSANESVHEELTATAHDPYWIHAQWVLKRSTVMRAEAALGAEWFRAVPVIRVYGIKADDVNGVSTRWVRDVEIHGECDHWFVPVENPPGTFKLEVGYATPKGKFFALAKSRKVATPKPGSRAAERMASHRNGSARTAITDPQFEKFLAARAASYSTGPAEQLGGTSGHDDSVFNLDAELVVSGTAEPNCRFTVQDQTIKVGKDGRFTARVVLGDGRQVIPATCISPDGSEKRTVILAFERNRKRPPKRSSRHG